MGDYNKFSKGNNRKELVGRNANFVLLEIYEILEYRRDVKLRITNHHRTPSGNLTQTSTRICLCEII